MRLFERLTRNERRFTSLRKVDARSGMRINGLRDGVTQYDVGVANIVFPQMINLYVFFSLFKNWVGGCHIANGNGVDLTHSHARPSPTAAGTQLKINSGTTWGWEGGGVGDGLFRNGPRPVPRPA